MTRTDATSTDPSRGDAVPGGAAGIRQSEIHSSETRSAGDGHPSNPGADATVGLERWLCDDHAPAGRARETFPARRFTADPVAVDGALVVALGAEQEPLPTLRPERVSAPLDRFEAGVRSEFHYALLTVPTLFTRDFCKIECLSSVESVGSDPDEVRRPRALGGVLDLELDVLSLL